jgi:hypothetical protein
MSSTEPTEPKVEETKPAETTEVDTTPLLDGIPSVMFIMVQRPPCAPR